MEGDFPVGDLIASLGPRITATRGVSGVLGRSLWHRDRDALAPTPLKKNLRLMQMGY
jgi:hypothetical protein